MISNKDMVFADAFFSNLFVSNSYKNFELGLNYRRNFRESTLQPFAQLGIGHGHIDYPSCDFIADRDDDYI